MRGLASGLAEGINQGTQMFIAYQGLKSRQKADERADAADAREQEAHDLKMQEVANNRKLTETMASLMGWTPEMAAGSPVRPDAPSLNAPQPQQTPSQAVNLAGPIPQGGLSMNAPQAPYAADNPLPGLKPQAPPQQPAREPISAAEYVQKQGVTPGGIFSNPQALNKLAATAMSLGLGDKGIAFLNMMYQAHEKAIPQAMSQLLLGDGKGAAEVLRSRGMNIEGDLTPVPDKEHVWKATVDGKEKEFSLREMGMMANPLNFYEKMDEINERKRKATLEQDKHDLEKNKFEEDKKKNAAEIDVLREKKGLYRAQAGKANRTDGGNVSSAKEIKEAKADRKLQFDRAATMQDETGKQVMDPQKRNDLDRATYAQQSMLETELGGRLSADQHRELTEAMLDFPMGGDKAKVQQWQNQLLDRFGLDPAEDDRPVEKGNQGQGLGGKGAAAREKTPPPEALKKEPTQEEKEIQAVSSDAEAVPEMKRLQRERTATNLSPQERVENARKIADLIARHGPKGQGGQGGLGYGNRPDGTPKGKGFLGVQKSKSGKDMTEYSVGININGKERDVPTLVPGLTKKELDYLKTEPDLSKRTPMNDAIIKKAEAHARKRLKEGKSVFADEA